MATEHIIFYWYFTCSYTDNNQTRLNFIYKVQFKWLKWIKNKISSLKVKMG